MESWHNQLKTNDNVATMKPVTIILLVVVVGIWLVFSFLVTSIILYKGAYLSYLLTSPSSERECKKIRPGMDLHRVIAITSNHAEPGDQGLVGDEVYFSRADRSCHVEMDPALMQVKRVYVTKDIEIR